MRVDGHEQHALSLIENYWAAGFHWIAYGCQQKHGRHKENHTQLSRYLRDLGELAIGAAWDRLESKRQGSMYAYHTALNDVQQAHDDWQEIRAWALS